MINRAFEIVVVTWLITCLVFPTGVGRWLGQIHKAYQLEMKSAEGPTQ